MGMAEENYDKAVELVRKENRATFTLIQRRLGLGFTTASRIMDKMEAKGIVGPYSGNVPRRVFQPKGR